MIDLDPIALHDPAAVRDRKRSATSATAFFLAFHGKTWLARAKEDEVSRRRIALHESIFKRSGQTGQVLHITEPSVLVARILLAAPMQSDCTRVGMTLPRSRVRARVTRYTSVYYCMYARVPSW